MLKWFTLSAALDELAEGVEFRLGQIAFKVQVEFHAWELQHVGEQQLCLQTRRVHALLGEKFGTLRDDFENGHFRFFTTDEPG